MDNLNDVLKMFDGKVVEPQEDKDTEIPALEGRYEAEIKKFNLIENKDGGSFFSANLCITKTITGVEGKNRWVSKTYNNGETSYGTAEENMESLLRGLASMGIDKGNTWDELVANCKAAEGKTINLKLRPQKDKGIVKRDDKGWAKHYVTIVKEFDLTNVKETPVVSNEKIPF